MRTNKFQALSVVLCALLCALIAGLVFVAVTYPSALRWCVAALLLGTIALMDKVSVRASLGTLIAFVLTMAMLRRVLDYAGLAGGPVDPVLLVIPLWASLSARWTARPESPRLNAPVLAIACGFCIASINPLGGSVVASVMALAQFLTPLAVYFAYVHRLTVDDYNWLVRKIPFILIPFAIYGLLQTFRGFPVWDEYWVLERGYAALNVGGAIRAFSTFASAQEYAVTMALGATVAVAQSLTRGLVGTIYLAVSGVLATAAFLTGSRGATLFALMSIAVVLLARFRVRWWVGLPVGAAVALGMAQVVAQVAVGGGSAAAIIAHQEEGLTAPFTSESSGATHLSLIGRALLSAVQNPLGIGLAPLNRGGGARAVADRNDVSIVATTLGLIGLALLAWLVVRVVSAYKESRRREMLGREAELCLLGSLVVTANAWLNGSLYSVSTLLWITIAALASASGSSEPVARPARVGRVAETGSASVSVAGRERQSDQMMTEALNDTDGSTGDRRDTNGKGLARRVRGGAGPISQEPRVKLQRGATR